MVELDELRGAVLDWYGPRRHAYSWRRGRRDPYRVLVSEVMLQQTQASRVEPIFEAFVDRFPDVGALAAASRADVLRAWAGLGYHRRAVSLHKAARTIVRDHHGRVPRDREALRRLPGIGPYTADAVASIGFGDPVPAMDTNVRRICSRVFHGAEPEELPATAVAAAAHAWLDTTAPAVWNQALMDLGRVACRPRPRCDVCPVRAGCAFVTAGRVGRPSSRRPSPFEGSTRQHRGAVVRALRERGSLEPAALAREAGVDLDPTEAAIASLIRDGIVERTRAGRLRLPRR